MVQQRPLSEQIAGAGDTQTALLTANVLEQPDAPSLEQESPIGRVPVLE
jgi:hypothetical protein